MQIPKSYGSAEHLQDNSNANQTDETPLSRFQFFAPSHHFEGGRNPIQNVIYFTLIIPGGTPSPAYPAEISDLFELDALTLTICCIRALLFALMLPSRWISM
jgi:hypothetical protein